MSNRVQFEFPYDFSDVNILDTLQEEVILKNGKTGYCPLPHIDDEKRDAVLVARFNEQTNTLEVECNLESCPYYTRLKLKLVEE